MCIEGDTELEVSIFKSTPMHSHLSDGASVPDSPDDSTLESIVQRDFLNIKEGWQKIQTSKREVGCRVCAAVCFQVSGSINNKTKKNLFLLRLCNSRGPMKHVEELHWCGSAARHRTDSHLVLESSRCMDPEKEKGTSSLPISPFRLTFVF